VRPRNVLVITLDTMRADRLPAYGFSGVATPAIDRLAAEGVVFEQAFSPVPLTLPSHATLFTGLLPQRAGVRDNAGSPVPDGSTTLAEVLGGRGLATGAFVASAVLAPGRGLDQGFAVYNAAAPPACAGPARARRTADEVVDEALTWLDQRDGQAFMAWLHFYDTHRPYRIPDEYLRLYADPYLAGIAFEDVQIARVIDYLERRGLLDDTLIVLAGDHGESLGDHGEETHGIFVYQEALHVPLIVRAPRVSPRYVAAPVRLADVTPTILDLLGVPALASADGVSLVPLIEGSGADPRLEVYAESMYPRRFGWSGLRSLRAGRYKVIDAPRPELFDLDTDPYEQRNIFGDQPSIGAAMIGKLAAYDVERAAPAAAAPVDPALAARLASLGYVSGGPDPPAVPAAEGIDPKDTIELFNRMTRMQAERAVLDWRAPGCGS
jgi:arylsulfatase A-like enzyme